MTLSRRTPLSPGQFRTSAPRTADGAIAWSSLTRRQGLSRSGLAVVRGDGAPVAQIRPQRAFPAAFTPKVRGLIHARSGGFCEACGIPLPDGRGQCQHRVARGMGGSRNPLLGSPANGADLCGTPASGCHGKCEARDPHMYEAGFWLNSWENPLARPVMLHGPGGGVTVWFAADGTYAYEPPGWGAA